MPPLSGSTQASEAEPKRIKKDFESKVKARLMAIFKHNSKAKFFGQASINLFTLINVQLNLYDEIGNLLHT